MHRLALAIAFIASSAAADSPRFNRFEACPPEEDPCPVWVNEADDEDQRAALDPDETPEDFPVDAVLSVWHPDPWCGDLEVWRVVETWDGDRYWVSVPKGIRPSVQAIEAGLYCVDTDANVEE